MISGIVPRPIAFVSSISEAGNLNLAPYSFFTGFAANPPIVGFSPALSGRTGLPKDTLLNIKETEEFTISIVNSDMVGQVSLASCEYDRDTDEFYKTGLEKENSLIVKPPFVKQSPFVMECKLYDIVHLGNKPASGNLILGEKPFMSAAASFRNFWSTTPFLYMNSITSRISLLVISRSLNAFTCDNATCPLSKPLYCKSTNLGNIMWYG